VSIWLFFATASLLSLILASVSIDDKYVMIALFGALAYPYRFSIPLGPLNSFSIVDVALVIAIVAVSLRRLLRTSQTTGGPEVPFKAGAIDLLVWGFVGVNLLSLTWAENRNLAIRRLVPILENVAFYYLIIFYASNRSRAKNVADWYLTLGVVALALSLFYYFGQLRFLEINPAQLEDETLSASIRTRLGSPAWGASNYFASIYLLFLPAYIGFATLSKGVRQRLLFGVIAAVGLFAFFFTFSRGGYVALIVGILLGLVLVVRRRGIAGRMLVGTLVVSLVIAVSLRVAMDYFPEVDRAMAEITGRVLLADDVNTTIRLVFVEAALNSIAHHALGFGTGNFSALSALEGSGVHNIYLQTALEIGWLGFFVFVLMLGEMLRLNWQLLARLRDTPDEPRAVWLVVSFVAVLVNVAGEASFEGIVFGWLFWTSQGLVRALHRSYPRPFRIPARGGRFRR
jgi:O-antigen ligase